MKHLSALVMTVFLSCVLQVYCLGNKVEGKACDANLLEQCHNLEACSIISTKVDPMTHHLPGVCTCLPEHIRDENGVCISEEAAQHGSLYGHRSTSTSSVAAGVLIPLTLIAGIGALIYFGRRYQWWHKLRQVPIRQYDTVLIGSRMEGDDDPPIS